MNKIKVKIVKYDMTKTKNRNRKDMLVDEQSERAVAAQLERIHKCEKVVTIHEIVWDEKQIQEVARLDTVKQDQLFYGTVKFFDREKGFGFIKPQADMDDLFFHESACKDGVPGDKDRVEFEVSEGPKGLAAIKVRVLEPEKMGWD